jgi:hypothetical protein
MNQALQPLPAFEERALLDLVRANGLDASRLECYMTRQRASGHGKHPDDGRGFQSGRGFNVSYNLMLCEWCGNLMPRRVCPAKAAALRERLRLNG